MAKARGLPDSFKLNVSPTISKPVELGDYLDDEIPQPVRQPPPAAPAPVPERAPLQVVPDPEPVDDARAEEAQPDEPVRQPVERAERRARQVSPTPQPVAAPARLRTTVPRKQINMNPETLGMVDQLLDFVQTYSVQKDLKASELFHALVLAVFEAREGLDLSRVQPRGRWGTPTAAALPVALKNAFQKAIRQYGEPRQ